MASGIARVTRFRDRATGRVYWVEYRTGFRGREYDFGGGWRPTPAAAREAAEKSGTINESREDKTP